MRYKLLLDGFRLGACYISSALSRWWPISVFYLLRSHTALSASRLPHDPAPAPTLVTSRHGRIRLYHDGERAVHLSACVSDCSHNPHQLSCFICELPPAARPRAPHTPCHESLTCHCRTPALTDWSSKTPTARRSWPSPRSSSISRHTCAARSTLPLPLV